MNLAGPWLLGIDGGGTKTVAMLSNQDGSVSGQGQSDGSNAQGTGVLAEMEAAIQQALAQAGLPASTAFAAVVVGLAGAGRPEDRPPVEDWLRARFPSARTLLVTDAELILAALEGRPGLAIISGTGSIVWGQDQQGIPARAGGWGPLLGDDGSGYQIGLEALRAITRAWDQVDPPTLLTGPLLSALGLNAPSELVRFIGRTAPPPASVARLAPLVLDCASTSDDAAIRIIAGASSALARQAMVVVRRLDLAFPVACAMAGSLLVHSRTLRELLLQRAADQGLRLDPVQIVEHPCAQALAWARRLLETTLPPKA